MTNSARPARLAEPGQGLVFGQRVLVADGAMGTLTEEFQLVPEQSTDALIAFHPEARYFSA